MKVIELLVKMANKEKLPNKVLINDKVYYLLKRDDKYIYSKSNDARDWERDLDHSLNICICLNDEVTILDKVEILEDKPKKIELLNIEEYHTSNPLLAFNENAIELKINKLIGNQKEIANKVNYLLEKSDKL